MLKQFANVKSCNFLLIVRGDKDHLFSRKSAAELADCIPDSTFLNIPFAAHESFKDQPEIFKIVVNAFLYK